MQLSVIVEGQKSSLDDVPSLAVLCAANGYVLTPLVIAKTFQIDLEELFMSVITVSSFISHTALPNRALTSTYVRIENVKKIQQAMLKKLQQNNFVRVTLGHFNHKGLGQEAGIVLGDCICRKIQSRMLYRSYSIPQSKIVG